jgi:hypothetical protein
VDFLVWQGYPAPWIMELTLRQLMAYLEAASARSAMTAKALSSNLPIP